MSVFPLRRRARAKASDAPPLDLVAALPLPVVVLDAAGAVALANAAAEAFLNASQASLTERGLAASFAADAPLVALIADARGAGTDLTAYDSEIALAGGRTVRADVFVTPLTDAAGWTMLSFQARTVPALVARQLINQSAARSAVGVAAMLAHEIKNPLSGIRGAAQLLGASADAEARELTGLICAEVDRVAALIDRMEGFTDTRPVPKAPENIHAVLGHVRSVALSGFARGIAIRERYDPSLPAVDGNRDQLIQVVLNLVKNAAEALSDAAVVKGEITLTTAFQQGMRLSVPGSIQRMRLPLVVAVRDNGPGIPDDIRANLFDPFVTSKPTGSGLGLALVAKIVSDHGGLIEVDSRPGRTEFRLHLPVLIDDAEDLR